MSLDTHKRDFSTNARLPGVSALAAGIGALSTLAAFVLLSLIHLFTNLFFFGTLSFADRSPAHNTLRVWVILVPVTGGLIVGLMARYGSEKIRGHGIPEAIEAILFGKSRMSPKVAVLKPLSSGLVIGSRGPFGAVSARLADRAGRKSDFGGAQDAARRGRRRGHDGRVRHARRRRAARRRTA